MTRLHSLHISFITLSLHQWFYDRWSSIDDLYYSFGHFVRESSLDETMKKPNMIMTNDKIVCISLFIQAELKNNNEHGERVFSTGNSVGKQRSQSRLRKSLFGRCELLIESLISYSSLLSKIIYIYVCVYM